MGEEENDSNNRNKALLIFPFHVVVLSYRSLVRDYDLISVCIRHFLTVLSAYTLNKHNYELKRTAEGF